MNFQLLADTILKGIGEVRRKGNVEGISSFYVTGIPMDWCNIEIRPYTGRHGEYISMWIRDRLVSAHSFVRTEK